MKVLIGKTLLRLVILLSYGLFVAWLFTVIEKTDEPAPHVRKEKELQVLRKKMNQTYNLTDNDFHSFVQKIEKAVREGDKLDWTFLKSAGFVFAALTTIGKVLNHWCQIICLFGVAIQECSPARFKLPVENYWCLFANRLVGPIESTFIHEYLRRCLVAWHPARFKLPAENWKNYLQISW